MSRTRAFWIVFALAGLLCGWLAQRQFVRVFPIVSLEVRMDRAGALREARALAAAHGWGPAAPYEEAASFAVDDTVRTFVELKGGGADAFRAMLKSGLYPAYTWHVRHFRENDANETLVRFTPEGTPCGFVEHIEEDAPGASLDDSTARAIAEREAADQWHLDLAPYMRAGSSRQTHPSSGRTDHTFVYERTDARVGDGRYRLRLVVSGDRLTELTRYLLVPEAFSRHYEEMRSANDGIAFGAQVLMVVLYLLGGVGVGLFFLLRRRRVLWRAPLALGAAVAALSGLSVLNTLPLAWMGYDTAMPRGTFLFQIFAAAMGMFLLMGAVLVVSFMAAESLTRTAFPRHPQLWRIWSREAGSSIQVAGRTVGGYLLGGIEFAYVLAFYFVTMRFLGWWSPSEALVSPDVLATYVPWLGAVAPSLQAGIWEECLFRAVPLSAAALLGERFGRRRLWIIGTLILQALVFGGGHANYPSEPAYARLVELIVPSLVWGLVYLSFGLVPTIITHFLFDLTLFSLPLFTSSARGVWVDQTMVVLFGLAPLGMVLVSRLRAGAWRELPDELRNGGWTPPPEAPPVAVPAVEAEVPETRLPRAAVTWMWAAGIAGFALWLAGAPWQVDAPPLRIGRADAETRGRAAAEAQGFEPAAGWRALVDDQAGPGLEHIFVWRTAGADTYRQLVGTYLGPPGWNVRFATFQGPVAERAEEWRVELGPDGERRRVQHVLPQDRAGATLERDDARAVAVAALRDRLGADAAGLREISAEATQQKNRRDWTFTWSDTASHVLSEGDLRYAVEVAGDRATDARRFVHVPESWQRGYKRQQATLDVLRSSRSVLAILIAIAAAVVAVVAWSRRRYPWRFAMSAAGIWLVLLAAVWLNNLPQIQARFQTAQPWDLQNAEILAAVLLVQLLTALGVGLMGGLVHGAARTERGTRAPATLGIAAGLGVAGVIAVEVLLRRGSDPVWPSYAAAQTLVPFLAAALQPAWQAFLRAGLLLSVLAMVHAGSRRWTSARPAYGALLFVAGGILGNAGTAPDVALWFAQAALSGAALVTLYVLVLRHDLTLVPVMLGTLVGLQMLRVIVQHAYPAAVPGALAGLVLAALVAAVWTRAMRAPGEEAPASPPA